MDDTYFDPEDLRRWADQDEDWPEPEPLPSGLPSVQAFECDLLPGALRPWVQDITDRMQCPPDYPAVGAMIAMATVCGRQVGIRPKARDDWTVVPNLWGAVIGRPALLKTPAIQEPLRMVASLEARAREEHEDALRDYEADGLVREAIGKEAKVKIAKAVKDKDMALASAYAAEATTTTDAPSRRRYLTQDSTVEKLGELLRDNPRGILVYRDELVGFLRSLEQDGREGSRAFFLEAWNGTGGFIFDRIGRGTVEVEAACVSLIGAIQPGPLGDYLRAAVNGGAGDDGLIQRFQLAVWPDPSREWRNIDRWPDTQARQAAREVFTRLDNLSAADLGARLEEGDHVPWLRFDAIAQRIFDEWRHELETRIRGDDLHPALESHLAKFRSLVPSLALLSHLADDPQKGAVGEPAILRALAWAEYLESHAKRIYAPAMAADLFAAIDLARRLRDLPHPLAARDIYRKHWRGLDVEGTRDALDTLEDLGHIRAIEANAEVRGRPTVRYEVHPSIRRAWS